MPSSSSSERPSSATTAPAACLPAPVAAGQGVGTSSPKFYGYWTASAVMRRAFIEHVDVSDELLSRCAVHVIGFGCYVPPAPTSGNETRTGRPPVHATAAQRKAAYRAAKARIDYTDSPEIVAKLHETAAELDCSVNELLRSMVRFAQTNRNWKQLGLFGARRNGELQ